MTPAANPSPAGADRSRAVSSGNPPLLSVQERQTKKCVEIDKFVQLSPDRSLILVCLETLLAPTLLALTQDCVTSLHIIFH